VAKKAKTVEEEEEEEKGKVIGKNIIKNSGCL